MMDHLKIYLDYQSNMQMDPLLASQVAMATLPTLEILVMHRHVDSEIFWYIVEVGELNLLNLPTHTSEHSY